MRSNHHLIDPALTSFADECFATLARMTVYVGALVLFAIPDLHAWDPLQLDMAGDAAGLYPGSRSRPLLPPACLILTKNQ